MTIKQEISNCIAKSIKKLQREKVWPGFEMPEIHLEHPEDKSFGDYATNMAMLLAKQVKKEPSKVAETLKQKLEVKSKNLFEKIEVAKPGFINFFLAKDYYQKQVKEILKQKEKFGQSNIGQNRKVQVEFISANPTGLLTVGNARGGPFGDVLGNVLKKAGFQVEKAYYINDYGMQVLALGHSVLKDSQAKYRGKYIDELNKKVKEKDPYKAGQKAAKIIIEEMIKKTTERMGIKYDEWFSEKKLHQSSQVDQALAVLKKKGLIYEKEGAKFFRSAKYGDQRDRVVVKKDDWKTYLAGDIAYHKYKFEKKKFDKVIDVWGADHYGDMPGLQAAMEALGHKGKLDIVILQFVSIIEKGKGLKMSKRAGTYVTMDELLDSVGSDVTRFFFLQKSAATHLNFDLSLAKEQSEKNPVYYIQYAYARICSILRKSKEKKPELGRTSLALLKEPSELALIQELSKLPEIIEEVAKSYQVQRLPYLATEIAKAFHFFYKSCRVLVEEPELRKARLSLILATQIVLKNILTLMGIEAPEKM
ncbi:MAG TPA: arginine--tRNA ligase [Candidatus Portnoybacteria bacterium]|nr:arginine--tRNA ligase [Candidatus Portnoybacteria bacterium]